MPPDRKICTCKKKALNRLQTLCKHFIRNVSCQHTPAQGRWWYLICLWLLLINKCKQFFSVTSVAISALTMGTTSEWRRHWSLFTLTGCRINRWCLCLLTIREWSLQLCNFSNCLLFLFPAMKDQCLRYFNSTLGGQFDYFFPRVSCPLHGILGCKYHWLFTKWICDVSIKTVYWMGIIRGSQVWLSWNIPLFLPKAKTAAQKPVKSPSSVLL